MSNALYRTNRVDEAFAYLDSIQTTDEILLEAIERQKEIFEGKIDPGSELINR